MIFVNGDKYEGDWVEGLKEGFGIFTTEGSKYEGNWSNDEKDG